MHRPKNTLVGAYAPPAVHMHRRPHCLTDMNNRFDNLYTIKQGVQREDIKVEIYHRIVAQFNVN